METSLLKRRVLLCRHMKTSILTNQLEIYAKYIEENCVALSNSVAFIDGTVIGVAKAEILVYKGLCEMGTRGNMK